VRAAKRDWLGKEIKHDAIPQAARIVLAGRPGVLYSGGTPHHGDYSLTWIGSGLPIWTERPGVLRQRVRLDVALLVDSGNSRLSHSNPARVSTPNHLAGEG
jgi:hypothetical protein